MGKREVRTVQANELRITRADDGSKMLSALIPYNSDSVDLGGFTETIAPGAFKAALGADADVLCLRDHDSSILLGRTKSKTLSLEDSPNGLRYKCKLPNTTQASDLAESVDRGDLDATSFGFQTISDTWLEDKATGTVRRTLNEVELFEVSPCSFPAYPSSSVSFRSCPLELRSRLTTKRGDDNDDGTDMECECECSQCAGGDCGICSNEACDDEACRCQYSSRSTAPVATGEAERTAANDMLLRIRIGLGELPVR
jgi:uncharacterized protein